MAGRRSTVITIAGRSHRMRRRDFLGVIYGAAAAGLPFAAAAQQAGKIWRIGHVGTSTPEIGAIFAQALEQRLADLGYVQGRNIVLLHRFPGPQPDKIEKAVISLVPQVDLLVVWAEAAIAAKKLAGGVPTVFISIGFPVERGLVQSLAHPGGNMTGITSEAALETSGKRLQILKEIVPALKRVAVLGVVGETDIGAENTSLELAARELGLTLIPVYINSADDLDGAFADMKKSEAEALFVAKIGANRHLISVESGR
jgi:putative tryptophan/tyrosine transport system substrate-binding protein